MGGDTVSVPSSTIDDDEAGVNESVIRESDNRMRSDYERVIKSYHDMKDRLENIEVDKTKVLSYTPGSWVENVGGMTMRDCNVPKTTTLLLIGPKGSGKSSLVNRISRVFEDDKFAPERAQVAYNSSVGDGTCFLQEYMIPRNSTSFCLYDTRGFSNDLSENAEMIKQWMTKGVRHGELVNSSNLIARMKCSQDKLLTYERRRVDFVIFVINGLSVLKCLESGGADTQYMHMVEQVFRSPFLSFKDHKPVIAITHGDLLSLSERALVRVHIGNVLGVHPIKQMFDVPDNHEPITELAIVDLVRYALEHADRNLPPKSQPTISKGSSILLWTRLLLLLSIGIFMFTVHLHGLYPLKLNPESVGEPSLHIKKAMEFDQVFVPEPDVGIKKDTEFDQGSVPKSDQEIKEVTEFDQAVLESDLEIKEVTEFDRESVPEIDLELKKVTEIDESDVEKKDVTEIDPGIVPEDILEMKKVFPGSVPKPSKKTKKGNAEKAPGRNQKTKKVHDPDIDWKTIRYIW